jgi:hypothetical protein
MDTRTALLVVLVIGSLWSGWQRWIFRPVHPPDGPIAPGEPLQTEVETATTVRNGRWTLTPRAHYDITARILSREDYHFDALADLVPEDLALGWGPMSDNRVLSAFDISQGARFYTWHPRSVLPIAREAVIAHSANTHVVPADAHIRTQLARVRVGEVLRLTGILVDAVRDDGAFLRTSLTRSDSGAGACEVMLVQAVDTHPLPRRDERPSS